MNKNNRATQGERHSVDFNKLIEGIDNLRITQRMAIAQKLLGRDSGLTVVMGRKKPISSSLILQVNDNAENISQQLKSLPPDLCAELVKAIGLWFGQQK